MIVNFSNIDQNERPMLILKRADETPIGVLGYAVDVEFEPHYNELSILNFRLPAYVDGKEVPFYDELTGLKIVELKGIAQFVLNKPVESGDAVNVSKQVEAYSLEHEFARKKIVLPESTYKFFSSTNPEGTLLGMIMEMMPNWHVGSVASSIVNKYRTFDVSNENLYNFMIDTVQEAYNCIFEFDTLNRMVNVRDASLDAAQRQVYISRENLAKDIEVEENLDDLVTRLDVSGADGVDIREVNPTGSNQIINLDYFMTEDNFSAELIAKYNAWKQLIEDNKQPFYNYAIQYSILVAQEITENAKLADLQGEYTSLENIQNVIIQGVASKIKTQEDLDKANADLAAKQAEIDAKQAEIDDVVANKNEAMASMKAISNACAYAKYFTIAEQKAMDAYIKDDEIADASFVASEIQTYTDGAGNKLANKTVTITGGEVSTVTTAAGSNVYTINNGTMNVADLVTGQSISAVFEKRTSGKIVLSIYAGSGSFTGTSFPSACITISGTGDIQANDTSITCSITDAYMFFSLNASDFEKKTVAWDLYAYGEEILRKLASPSYTFSVDSANFIALSEFEKFKNELELGQKVYIGITKDRVLKPICTGAKIRYAEKPSLELMFSDTYTANDSSFKLADILGNGISMGKTLSTGKFTYQAFTESGASTELRKFIESALDTAKNAIMSSTEQAVSWDGAGLRLRKWKNEAHTAYDPEQIWMSNNSITMTDDGWATAKMTIGKFYDVNLGNCWGIVAPMVVGTLLAGEELVIESQKKSGSQTGERVMFRVDADGARLYNADFEIQKTNEDGTTTQILLDPSVGMVMGYYPVKNQDGTISFDPDDSQGSNAKFFADKDGNLYLAGSIYSFDGIIGGWTISQDGLYSGKTDAESVGMTSSGDIRIWAGKLSENKDKAPFYVKQDGTLYASLGKVGGWYIGSDYIGNADKRDDSAVGMAASTVGTDIVFWAGNTNAATANFQVLENGKLISKNIEVTGGSISLKTEDNKQIFYVDEDYGLIGGWYVSPDHLGNARTRSGSNVGMSSLGGTGIAIWAGNDSNDVSTAKFRVTGGGEVTASDLHIYGGTIEIKNTAGEIMFSVSNQGELMAQSGTVGGWYIGRDYIGNRSTMVSSSVGLHVPKQFSPLANYTAGERVLYSNIVYIFTTAHPAGSWDSAHVTKLYDNETDDIALWIGDSIQTKAKFYVTVGGVVHASELNIYGGSISIKNDSGDEMFSVTSLGSLTAKDGTIGGWYISPDHIGTVAKKSDSTVGMANATGTSVAFWAGNTNGIATAAFRVTGAGSITATDGTVGGWYIGSNYIGNAAQKNNSTVGLASSTTGTDIIMWAGSSTPSSSTFYVQANGKLHCADLDISGGGLNVNNGIFKVESDGTMTAKKGTIGGWSISADCLYTGTGTNCVCLNGVGAMPQSWAMWCGADWPEAVPSGKSGTGWAPFRVTRWGDVYINALMVWDGTKWVKIDFSGNFKNAVSLSAGGSWSGNTFTATISLWGKINKTISIAAKYTVAVDGTYQGFNISTKRLTFSIGVTHSVNNVSKGEEITYDRGMDVSALYDIVHQKGVDDAKSGTTISAGLRLGSDGKSYDYRGVASGTISKTGDWTNTGTVIWQNGVDSVSLQNQRQPGPYTTNGWKTVNPSSGYVAMKQCYFKVDVSSGGGTCFVGGTMVKMASGEDRPIETLTPGTMVMAYNEETHEFTESEVMTVQMFKHADDIHEIHIANGKVITLTGSHPVLTRQGWKAINVMQAKAEHFVDIEELHAGDEVMTINGYVVIDEIVDRDDLFNYTVYNIDVEPNDTYIAEDTVVHNAESKD